MSSDGERRSAAEDCATDGAGARRRVVAIAAVAEGGVIGLKGTMPWRVPGDLAFFKETTLGSTIIMGSRTLEGLGRALPGRETVGLSKDPEWAMDGVVVAHSVEQALDIAASDTVFVAGGAVVYATAMPFVDELLISRIPGSYEGDTFFPSIDPHTWALVASEPRDGFTVERYLRRL